jgi:AbrB family looped-hinge helix DNA binding protein
MKTTCTVTSKGQITLPKDLRDKYHLKEGEVVVIVDAGEGVLVKHAPHGLRGALKGRLDLEGFERDVRKLRKEWTL